MTERERASSRSSDAVRAIGVGATIGQYKIVARLRSGGMATLYLARRKGAAGFTRHVAIKVIHPHLAEDDYFVRMFVDEAKLAARIQHPNVVHVEELGEDDGIYFLAMEYVHGCSLAELLRALRRLDRWLTPELAVFITAEVAKGLHSAHEATDDAGRLLGVVHRDVSPQNVLISRAGHIKLIDFGVAKAQFRAGHTRTGALKGKLRYMAPEQLTSSMVDRRTDIYALGIVLWEMLARRRLFPGDDFEVIEQVRRPLVPPPSQFRDGLSEALDDALMSALDPYPERRPATARDLWQRLVEALPTAGRVDAKDLADLVEVVLGEELEERRRALPESLSGISMMPPELAARTASETDREHVLRTYTFSSPGQDMDPSSMEQPTVSEHPPPRRGASPLLPVAIGVGSVGLLTLGIGVLLLAFAQIREPAAAPHPAAAAQPASNEEASGAATPEAPAQASDPAEQAAEAPAAEGQVAGTVADAGSGTPPEVDPAQSRATSMQSGVRRVRPVHRDPTRVVPDVPIFDDDF